MADVGKCDWHASCSSSDVLIVVQSQCRLGGWFLLGCAVVVTGSIMRCSKCRKC